MKSVRSSIFSQVIDAREILKVRQAEKARLQLLQKLESYIQSAVWYNGKDKKSFLKYMYLTPKEYAHMTGKSEESARWIIKRSSDRLFELLSDNFVANIIDGDIEVLKTLNYRLELLVNRSVARDYVLSDVIQQIVAVEPKAAKYEVMDLLEEIKFLRKYSIAMFKKYLGNIDSDKLSYIIQVLNSNEAILIDDKVEILEEFHSAKLITKKITVPNDAFKIKQ